MYATLSDAKRIIARHYGADFQYRILSKAITYANPPIASGKLHLAWKRLSPGQDSLVRIGLVTSDGTVNWTWEDTPEEIVLQNITEDLDKVRADLEPTLKSVTLLCDSGRYPATLVAAAQKVTGSLIELMNALDAQKTPKLLVARVSATLRYMNLHYGQGFIQNVRVYLNGRIAFERYDSIGAQPSKGHASLVGDVLHAFGHEHELMK